MALTHAGRPFRVRQLVDGAHLIAVACAVERFEVRLARLAPIHAGDHGSHRMSAPLLTDDRRRAEQDPRLAPIAALYPFASHFLEHPPEGAGGPVRQHYVDEGPRDGEPLLFLHGNPTWSFAWRQAIVALRDEYRCIAPDHVGCGLSDKPTDYAYRLTQHIENVERLVESLGLERITLVVHDWGGPIGLGFARRHPDLIARLVVMNTSAFPSNRMPLRIAACRIPMFGKLAVRGLNAFARAATWMAVEKPLPPAVKRGYLLPYDSWDNRVATLGFVEDIPMEPAHPSYAELGATAAGLNDFRDTPTAILWGDRDWCFDPTYRAQWQRRFPGAHVKIFHFAGHYLFEDEGPAVVAELKDFLSHTPLS